MTVFLVVEEDADGTRVEKGLLEVLDVVVVGTQNSQQSILAIEKQSKGLHILLSPYSQPED